MNEKERDLVRKALSHIDTGHPEFRGSLEVQAALDGPLRLYLKSWVLPPLRDAFGRRGRPSEDRRQEDRREGTDRRRTA